MRQTVMRFQPKLIYVAVAGLISGYANVQAADAVAEKIEVVSTTPLAGVGLPKELVPANIQTVKGEEIVKQNSLSIADFMSNSMLGVNVNEVQNNPFQPNVNYRGFSASPLLGTPQGISVFVDGVRVNEAFGDVVNWDLIPLNAIQGMQLVPGSNPVYGLNTLGGALSVQTKSGRTSPGGAVDLSGGSWGRVQGNAEYGGVSQDGSVDYFFAVNGFHEQGWRDFSPSDVRQAFGKIGWQGEKTDMNLSLTLADNELWGNGLVQKDFLKAQSYDSINTKPDITENKMLFLNYNLTHYFADDIIFSANSYYRKGRTRTLNGDVNDDLEIEDANADDFIDSDEIASANSNCLINDEADENCSGAINRTKSTRESYGATAQMTFTQDLFGHKNQFITGAGYDLGRTKFKQSSEFGLLTANRGVSGLGFDNDEARVDLVAKSRTWSLFATDTFSFNDMYHLTMSGRYNYTRINNRDKITPEGELESLTENASFNRFNPAIGLSITPSKELSFYGSYNEGSRAPTAIELGCAFQDTNGDGLGDTPCRLPNAMAGDPPLKKVVSKTFEAGVRGQLSQQLGYSASIYRTRNIDDIQFIAANSQGDGNFLNVGGTRREGLDLGLNGLFGTRFKWNLGYSYVRATYQSEFTIANEVNSNAIDTNGDGDGDQIQVKKGDYLSGIPKHQFKLRGEWQALPQWTIGSNIVAFSDQYSFGNENNAHQGEGAKVRGYTVVNLDTRYIFGNTGWQAYARVNNIFDREYYSAGMLGESFFTANGQFAGNDEASFLVAPGAPRAGWIGVRYEFGGKKTASAAAVDVD